MAEATKVETKPYAKRFPELAYLFGGYFHEDQFDVFDWEGREPSYEGIIRYFKTQDSPTANKKIPNELREFLSITRNWDDDDLGEVMHEDLGSRYHAPSFKMTYREFLEGILKILEEPMAQTKSEIIPKFTG